MHWLGGREGIPVELEQLSVPRPPIIIDLYSQDEELARQLVELGYRGSGEVRGLPNRNPNMHCQQQFVGVKASVVHA